MRRKFARNKKFFKSPNGVSLLAALLVMSVVVAIGITVSTIVVFQVKVNAVVFQGHQNYYIAESGIEHALNVLKEKKSGTLAAGLTAIQTANPFPAGIPGQADLTQSIGIAGGATVPTELKENSSVYIELYNVDASITPIAPQTPILCVYGTGSGDEVLEVSWVAWSESLEISNPQKTLISHTNFSQTASCDGGAHDGQTIDLTNFFPAFTPSGQLAGFRIRISAIKPTASSPGDGAGDVSNFEVYTNPSNLSTQIQVKSVSNTGGQTQALIATFPWSEPISSFFDFVIFSGETLRKEVPVSIGQNVKKFGPFIVQAGTNAIPATPSDPFVGCDANPCDYYIRLLSTGTPSPWGTFQVTTSGLGTNTVIATSSIASCILRNSYTFSATSATITFPSPLPPSLFQYELLSEPTFRDTNETYCPGN
ncbi:hypothetical protein C4546_01455 [Candidatus Parcubacteria bacterium]|jgi:hypothetical protein|nr:MAG: hypothetical protein C4546_01455 [Candidatus Parcubacteria bacterium]